MYDIKTFTQDEFGNVRVVMINGEPWFVGKDVSKILGYSNTRKALSDHVDNEDKTDGVTIRDSIGREQKPTFINESGLYSLIISSKLPSAKKFKRWVTSEVLPTIRETGNYVGNDEQTKAKLLLSIYNGGKEGVVAAKELTEIEVKEATEPLKKEIGHKEEVIIGLVDNISLAEKRQVLNRVVRYNHANYQNRWRVLYREFEQKYHIDLQQRFDRYNECHKPKCKNKLEYIDRVMRKIPELYEIASKIFENDVKELVQEMYDIVE